MIKLITIIGCLCSFHFAFSQNLTFKQLNQLQNKDLNEIDNFLSKKGWQLSSDSKPNEDFMGKAVWAFNQANFDGAAAWFVFYYLDDTKRVLYNITGRKTLNKIRKKVLKRMNKRHSGMQDEHHFTDYENENYVIRLFDYKEENYYGVKIFSKVDYMKAFKNGRL